MARFLQIADSLSKLLFREKESKIWTLPKPAFTIWIFLQQILSDLNKDHHAGMTQKRAEWISKLTVKGYFEKVSREGYTLVAHTHHTNFLGNTGLNSMGKMWSKNEFMDPNKTSGESKDDQDKLKNASVFAFFPLLSYRPGGSLPRMLPRKGTAIKLLISFSVPLWICKPHPCFPFWGEEMVQVKLAWKLERLELESSLCWPSWSSEGKSLQAELEDEISCQSFFHLQS